MLYRNNKGNTIPFHSEWFERNGHVMSVSPE